MLLAAFTGSCAGSLTASFDGSVAGVTAAAAGGVATGAVAVLVLLASGGAATTSAGLASVFSGVLAATDAVESILKSLMVGGGTLAGSGRGTAASIASSAAVL